MPSRGPADYEEGVVPGQIIGSACLHLLEVDLALELHEDARALREEALYFAGARDGDIVLFAQLVRA